MARYSGQNLVITFNSVSLEADFVSFEFNEEQKVAEVTAGNDTNATYVTTYKDGTASLTLYDVDDAQTAWNGLAVGTTGDLVIGPEGSTTGNPRMTVNAIALTRNRSFPFDDKIEIAAEFQFSGAVTEDTY